MRGYTLSPEAEEDLFQIWLYLAEEVSLEIADRIESRLYEAFEMLARNPGLGHKRTDLTKYPVLFFRVFPYSYLVIYQSKTLLEIVAILHAKRNIEQLLQHRVS